MAGELGAELSGVQSIQDTTQDPSLDAGTTGMGHVFGQAEPRPLAVGEILVTANVTVVFQLSETDFP